MLPKLLRGFAILVLVPAVLSTEATWHAYPRQAAVPILTNLWATTIFWSLVCWALAELLSRKP